MMDDDKLEDFFAAARAQAPRPSDDLMARVLADAEAAQRKPRFGWRAWVATLGGLPGVSGLVAATCVGFWIGVAPPDAVPDIAAGLLDAGYVEEVNPAVDGFGWDLEEG